MCSIMEDIVKKEREEASREARHEEFLRLIKKMWEQKFRDHPKFCVNLRCGVE